jgi:hypothetical protein
MKYMIIFNLILMSFSASAKVADFNRMIVESEVARQNIEKQLWQKPEAKAWKVTKKKIVTSNFAEPKQRVYDFQDTAKLNSRKEALEGKDRQQQNLDRVAAELELSEQY